MAGQDGNTVVAAASANTAALTMVFIDITLCWIDGSGRISKPTGFPWIACGARPHRAVSIEVRDRCKSTPDPEGHSERALAVLQRNLNASQRETSLNVS